MDEFETVTPLVRQAYGILDYDARTKIRKGWGFLERNAEEEKAQAIGGALGDLVSVIDNAVLKQPADPLTMTGFSFVEEGVVPRWQSPQEPGRLILWTDILAVAAGGFSEDVIRMESGGKDFKMGSKLMGLGMFALTGIPPGLLGGGDKKKDPKPVKSSRIITFGCVLTRRGEQLAFSPEKFDFGGLGVNKQMNTGGNFRVFVSELKRQSSARLNLGARYMMENKSLTLANYQSLGDFETELLWLLNT